METQIIKALAPLLVKYLEDLAAKQPSIDQKLIDAAIEAIVALAESLVK